MEYFWLHEMLNQLGEFLNVEKDFFESLGSLIEILDAENMFTIVSDVLQDFSILENYFNSNDMGRLREMLERNFGSSEVSNFRSAGFGRFALLEP